MENVLKVGDTVIWRGSWGRAAPQQARVEGIEETERGEKYGREVSELPWSRVRAGYAVVSLDNGHWAYGYQLEANHGS